MILPCHLSADAAAGERVDLQGTESAGRSLPFLRQAPRRTVDCGGDLCGKDTRIRKRHDCRPDGKAVGLDGGTAMVPGVRSPAWRLAGRTARHPASEPVWLAEKRRLSVLCGECRIVLSMFCGVVRSIADVGNLK